MTGWYPCCCTPGFCDETTFTDDFSTIKPGWYLKTGNNSATSLAIDDVTDERIEFTYEIGSQLPRLPGAQAYGLRCWKDPGSTPWIRSVEATIKNDAPWLQLSGPIENMGIRMAALTGGGTWGLTAIWWPDPSGWWTKEVYRIQTPTQWWDVVLSPANGDVLKITYQQTDAINAQIDYSVNGNIISTVTMPWVWEFDEPNRDPNYGFYFQSYSGFDLADHAGLLAFDDLIFGST